MKLEKLVGERFKEKPSDCTVESHALMVRGGYIKYVANGIFSSYMPLKRITRKIETILREEMDKIDGQEVQFPVVMPASLWEESGRYKTIGKELLRFNDRSDSPHVLGMTHEEAAVHLVREYGQSYNKYPFMIYQIQTKFRDELRVRAGLIRTREFIMKDGYSFHETQEDLEKYYKRCFDAYYRLFKRCGLKNITDVMSDTGDMGGKVAHEFQLINEMGEDTLYICDCGFRANKELEEKDCSVCPKCGKPLNKVRGIEIGNIFQLGKKYTESMHMTYTDKDGNEKTPIMGCYGIGVTRVMAAIIEESADDNGPIWNMETAPFAVEVIALPDKENKTFEFAEKIYNDLKKANIEVLLDNRDNRAGEKFADADLVAAPIRLIVSTKNLTNNQIEVKYRVNNYDTSNLPNAIDVNNYLNTIKDLISKLSQH